MTGIVMFFAALLMLGIGYPVAFTFGSISIFFGIIAAVVEVAPDFSYDGAVKSQIANSIRIEPVD